MAGRGRGQLTFSVEIVGIGKGENLPPSSVQPTPLFPPLDQKPVPLQTGEEAEYMLALKQEFRGAMKTLPFYIRPAAPKKDVERYSDKYQKIETSDNSLEWKPDWRRFPKELRVREKRPLRDSEYNVHMNEQNVCVSIQTLEQKEEDRSSDEEDGEKKKPQEEEAEGEEEYDEEEFEDETDYIMSYFDNGEEFGGDSDDNDEAIY
uniref:Polymerase (RNA) III (DNA directed) polypeptide G like b n=2 Tax=Cyprinus carpio TaxID=7962 RepID=A0A8C2CYI4_CYPCA